MVTKTKIEKVIETGSQRLLHELPHEKLAWMLQRMCEIRYFEEKAEDLYIRGLVHGTMHLSIGQEAGSVGSIATLRPDDLIIHHHRGHGHTIAKGANLTIMMAEFLGKETGYCRGRGGSMHIADIAGGNLGATGVVGGGLPTAVGIALALQMRRSDKILLSYFGDGASNEGEFHESLNMASTWKLPVVFICDNNQYGMSMHMSKVMNVEKISARAARPWMVTICLRFTKRYWKPMNEHAPVKVLHW
jgi:TPP-dependent pyruvate/acetoin dehydrogenase alpha subunit